MTDESRHLEQTRQAIVHLESAIAALKKDVLPVNPARFALMAEPIVGDIRDLRAEVERIVGVKAAEEILEAAETS